MSQSDRDRLIEGCLGLVTTLALSMRTRYTLSCELDELIALGRAGLVEAAQRFDPDRGTQFSTFAYYRIRGAIFDGLRAQGLHRTPALLSFAAEADALLENLGERRPEEPGLEPEQIRAELQETLADLSTAYVVVTSLDDPEDKEPAAEVPDLDDRITQNRIKEQLDLALDTLPEPERSLIRLHYYEEMTLTEVGQAMGMSRSWACRLHARALHLLTAAVSALPGWSSEGPLQESGP